MVGSLSGSSTGRAEGVGVDPAGGAAVARLRPEFLDT